MSDYESRTRIRTTPSISPATIVVTVIALAAGFFVIRSIDSREQSVTSLGAGSGSAVGEGGAPVLPTASTDATGSSVPTSSLGGPETTAPANTFSGAKVVVANANGTQGSAGKATAVLKSVTDFDMAEPTDANSDEKLSTSVVYYDANQQLTAEPVARTLARVLGGIAVQPLPDESPVANLNGAGALLMLGTDLAELTANDLKPPLKDGAAGAAQETANSTPNSAQANTATETTAGA